MEDSLSIIDKTYIDLDNRHFRNIEDLVSYIRTHFYACLNSEKFCKIDEVLLEFDVDTIGNDSEGYTTYPCLNVTFYKKETAEEIAEKKRNKEIAEIKKMMAKYPEVFGNVE